VAFYAAERSEYAARVLEGILQYVADHVGMLFTDYWDDAATPEQCDALVARPAPWSGFEPDGVVAILPHGPAIVPWVAAGGVPLVSLGSDYRDKLPTVHVSADSVAELAAQHLFETGYQNMAFVGVVGLVAVDHRRAALERYMARVGRPMWSYELATNPWPGHYGLERLAAHEPGLASFLQKMPKPLGILATTDHAGRAICEACRALGLSVPQEVGVLGIDNYSAARSCLPPLSSIHTPGEDVGYQAMVLLDRLMRGQPAGAPLAVPATKIVARQSTGAGSGGPESVVVRALALIRERACDGIAVEQILDEMTISRSTLERQFAAMVGRTPGQELTRARLARAKELLRTTDLSISRIAQMTGYERSSSFSDFFRRNEGMTPRAYRTSGVQGLTHANGDAV
jgi:LacI family transcriptional regulator